MKKYFDTVLSSNGSPVVGASVSIYNYGTSTLASLFSDSAGAVVLANPLTTNTLGYFEFYAADGRYSISVSVGGSTVSTITDVLLDDPANASAVVVSGGSVDNSPVGATTPSTGAFTTLSASSTVSGSGFSSYLASPPAIGSTTPSTGTFTTLIANTSIGLGATPFAGANFVASKNITGAANSFSIYTGSTILSDVTSIARGVATYLGTQATTFTLNNLYHFEASQNALGAGSSVANQFGFVAQSTLTGATNNYGFYGNIAAGAGRYNFYAAGTADNYFAGQIYTSSNLISVLSVAAQVNTAIPAGGTAGAGFKLSSTANFGVFFGSGAPTLSAAKGSLYLRSDGTTTNDRMYVNTNGSTGWTAVVTAA